MAMPDYALYSLASFGLGLAVGYVLFRRPTPPASKGLQQAARAQAAGRGGRGEHKMVLVVRTDLKMGSGKIAAQCGHATLGAYKAAMKRAPDTVKSWSRSGQAKIALKCPSLEEMHALAEKAERAGLITYIVADAGRTQIESGTETVCAIGPAAKLDLDEITGHLKLL